MKILCSMLARVAIISLVVIVFILPSILLAYEKIISVSSLHWKNKPQLKRRFQSANSKA